MGGGGSAWGLAGGGRCFGCGRQGFGGGGSCRVARARRGGESPEGGQGAAARREEVPAREWVLQGRHGVTFAFCRVASAAWACCRPGRRQLALAMLRLYPLSGWIARGLARSAGGGGRGAGGGRAPVWDRRDKRGAFIVYFYVF